MIRRPPSSTRTDTLFPYTTLVRSIKVQGGEAQQEFSALIVEALGQYGPVYFPNHDATTEHDLDQSPYRDEAPEFAPEYAPGQPGHQMLRRAITISGRSHAGQHGNLAQTLWVNVAGTGSAHMANKRRVTTCLHD